MLVSTNFFVHQFMKLLKENKLFSTFVVSFWPFTSRSFHIRHLELNYDKLIFFDSVLTVNKNKTKQKITDKNPKKTGKNYNSFFFADRQKTK